MIKTVSIQMNRSLICGGVAILERDDKGLDYVYFDILKKHPIRVIVGGRGKSISAEDADRLEQELLNLFVNHNIPLELGTVKVTA